MKFGIKINQKKGNNLGQIQVTFNWIYILIAGAVILIFFISIAARQKIISEENLAADVIQITQSIFVGAQVSEKTKSSIPTGGLSDKTFYFRCDQGIGEYGVEGLPARVQNSLDPIFAPPQVRSSRLILWSLPYFMPFKITDILLVTSNNHHYYFLGSGNGFTEEFIGGATDSDEKLSIKVKQVNSLSEIETVDNQLNIRLIDADGISIKSGTPLPESWRHLDDQMVTAVSFTANKEVLFFRKKGLVWNQLNFQPIPIVSFPSHRNAAYYGAVFTEDPETYLCNMQKAYQRIRLIAEVYENKVKELDSYYSSSRESANCRGFISGFTVAEGNVKDTLLLYKTRAKVCSVLADSSCLEIVDFAARLQSLNEKIAEECSITIY